MKPTYTLKPDLPDNPNGRRPLEEEQEDNLQAMIGLTLWAALEQREMEEETNAKR